VTNNTNSPNLKQAIVRGIHLRKMVLGKMLTHNPQDRANLLLGVSIRLFSSAHKMGIQEDQMVHPL
jgi:hypothetical protein